MFMSYEYVRKIFTFRLYENLTLRASATEYNELNQPNQNRYFNTFAMYR